MRWMFSGEIPDPVSDTHTLTLSPFNVLTRSVPPGSNITQASVNEDCPKRGV